MAERLERMERMERLGEKLQPSDEGTNGSQTRESD
jgi:hypothetical protein